MRMPKKTSILFVVLVIGMLLSLFLVYEHFSPSASKFCNFGANMDCGIVNKSPYANLDGISYLVSLHYYLPIPYINIADIHPVLDLLTSNGFLGFLFLLIVALLVMKYRHKEDLWFIKSDKLIYWIRGSLIFGVLYGAYLFFIQHSILKTYCPFCIALDTTMVIAVIISFLLRGEHDE